MKEKISNLEFQGGLSRFLSAFIDGTIVWVVPAVIAAIIGIPLFILTQVLTLEEDMVIIVALFSMLIYFIFLGILEIFNAIYYPYKTKGQSIGKKLMGLRIASLDGEELTLSKLAAREICLQLTMGMLGLFAVLPILFTEKKQALHDMMV
jgi:uncharacterized RDD family membrane protein YckC